jgi:ubiquinone/menaquinone biosynthesis C-methylase UbiE
LKQTLINHLSQIANRFIKHYDVERSYQVFLEFSKEHKPLTLDVGCGDRKKTLLFKKLVSDIVGLDISIEKIRKVREREINAVLGDAQFLPFRDNCFDAILSFHSIEHLVKPARALKEIHRTLRFRGFLLLVTPNKMRITNKIILMFMSLMKLKSKFRYPFNPDHIFELDKRSLQSIANIFSKIRVDPLFIGLKLAKLNIQVRFPKFFENYCDQWILLAIK